MSFQRTMSDAAADNKLRLVLLSTLLSLCASPVSGYQLVSEFCEMNPRLPVDRVYDNAAYPAAVNFPNFCQLSAHNLSPVRQMCCNCIAVPSNARCQAGQFPIAWTDGATNVTNLQQVYDIRKQKQIIKYQNRDYTLMFQFCCNRQWFDRQTADNRKTWTTQRSKIWQLIHSKDYKFTPEDSKECIDTEPEACRLGKAEGGCGQPDFAQLCKKSCKLCVVGNVAPPPQPAQPRTSTSSQPGCSSSQIPANKCGRGTSSTQLQYFFDEERFECLAMSYKSCSVDSQKANIHATYKQCAELCIPKDGPTCSGNRPAMTDEAGQTMICENDSECPAGHTCTRGAFFGVCCQTETEGAFAADYNPICTGGRRPKTFVDRGRVKTLLGRSCSDKFCPTGSSCVQSKVFAHCCAP